MAPGAGKTTPCTVSLVFAILFAGCLGTGPGPEPLKEDEPSYHEIMEHDSTSWEILFMVWPWPTDPLISGSSGGNVASTGWHHLTTIERPEGLQNATFVLEWEDTINPVPFEHVELVIGADQLGGPVPWQSVDGTRPLNLTIAADDWPEKQARLHFRAHDPDTSIAFYTWIQWELDMTFTKLILEDDEEENGGNARGSNDPGR